MELLVLKLVIALRSLGADGIIKLASDGLQRSKHGEVNEKILKHTIGCSLMLIPSYESYIIFNCYIRVMLSYLRMDCPWNEHVLLRSESKTDSANGRCLVIRIRR